MLGFRPAIAADIEKLQRIFDDGTERRTSFTLGEASAAMVDRVARIRAGEADPNAIKTGIASLDKFTGGLHRGEYLILGGRPSMGKTALAIQLAYNVAGNNGGVFYASLEMPVALLTPRFASCRLWAPDNASNIDYQRILRGEINDREMRWIESARDETQGLAAHHRRGAGPFGAGARGPRPDRQGEAGTAGQDARPHRCRPSPQDAACGRAVEGREYTEISSRLAEMAKRLDVPVLALAQLNRSVESRDDKRPQLADLRESGSIEQDADTVLFCYREAYYLERKRCPEPAAEADRLAELDAGRAPARTHHRKAAHRARSEPSSFGATWHRTSFAIRPISTGSGMELAA